MASKVVVVGAIEGRFDVFEKLSKLHAKNSFSLALFLGDFFANPDVSAEESEDMVTSLLNGNVLIPLPTYFTLGRYSLPMKVQARLEQTDGEVCSNLYFLGKRSTIKTSEGLRIVALGGSLNTDFAGNSPNDKFLPFHTEGDAKALHGANKADILVTSHWPSSIRVKSSVRLPDGMMEPQSEHCVADLCTALKPRYHFSTSSQFFYEREPFRFPKDEQADVTAVTRFISVAARDNASKEKWLYAFSIDPSTSLSNTLPAGTTTSPFPTASRKRQRLNDQKESYQRFSRMDSDHFRQHHPYKRARNKGSPPGPQECFFCLSNPNLATHLITSIGDDSYLTTAKGPLTTAKTFPSLVFPAHILIIPLSHSPMFSSVTPAETKSSTFKEMQRYRHAIQSLFASTSKGALGAVTWEISRAEGIHIHWQCLPVPADLIKRGLVEAGFKVEAENEKYPEWEAKEIDDGSREEGDYLRVWIWRPDEVTNAALDDHGKTFDGRDQQGEEKSMVLPLKADVRFDLQFPRKVMAKLLHLEGRMHWKDCAQNEAEEKYEADAFKAAFKTFDFSLEEAC